MGRTTQAENPTAEKYEQQRKTSPLAREQNWKSGTESGTQSQGASL